MRLCFLGTSHAAQTLARAAERKGFTLTDDLAGADLAFISEDTPTDENGVRDLKPILALVERVKTERRGSAVITSQVPPGFMRSIDDASFYHQAETLRIDDAMQRALYPEMLIVGFAYHSWEPCIPYWDYLHAFDCPILKMTYEDAEFAKMAINAFLVSQVETSKMLAGIAKICGADWQRVSRVLRHDSRIGKYAYLHPGEPLASKHLLRDYVTLLGLDPENKLLKAWR